MPDPQSTLQAWQSFLTTPLETTLQRHLQSNPEIALLALFNQVVATVPAYQTWLHTQGIDPATIQTWADFQRIPLATKEL
jgi:phenylacetate-CoA ligase